MNGKDEPCRLCQSMGELQLSHIFPEFLYKPLYDAKHRFIGLKPEPKPGASEARLQKGLREYLLCVSCEQHLSKFERYASRVLRDLPDTSGAAPGAVVRVTGIDYTSFKLFQLSLLWRAGVSNHAFFQQVYLGPHEKRLRQMIREGNPGDPLDYGCVLIRPSGPKKLDHFIVPPTPRRLLGHQGYLMLLAGMKLAFVVSRHSDRIHEKGLFLERDGILPILIDNETADDFVVGLAQNLRKAGLIGD